MPFHQPASKLPPTNPPSAPPPPPPPLPDDALRRLLAFLSRAKFEGVATAEGALAEAQRRWWPHQGLEPCHCVDVEAQVRQCFGQVGYPAVYLVLNEESVVRQAMDHLAALACWRGTIFFFGGVLLHAERVGGRVRSVQLPLLRTYLTAAAIYLRKTKEGDEHRALPMNICTAISCSQSWVGFPEVTVTSAAPLVEHDGRVLEGPGYDHATGAYLMDSAVGGAACPTVPQALDRLRFLLAEFPFASEADFAAFLAFMATFLVPPWRRGRPPVFLVNAAQQGTGKTLLLWIAYFIVSGAEVEVVNFPKDDAETDKRLTALLREAPDLIAFDNVRRALSGEALEAIATTGVYRARLLGVSETVRLPVTATLAFTGNNVEVAGDMARRVVPIRLRTSDENPERRTNYRISDIKAYVREHRQELLCCVLAIARAHAVAGAPQVCGAPPLGGFEDWCATVRQAVAFAGLPDPLEARDAFFAEADSGDEDLEELLDALHGFIKAAKTLENSAFWSDDERATVVAIREADGWMTSDQIRTVVLSAVRHDHQDTKSSPFAVLGRKLRDLCGQSGRVTSRSIGKCLARYRYRVLGGRQILIRKASAKHAQYITVGDETANPVWGVL